MFKYFLLLPAFSVTLENLNNKKALPAKVEQILRNLLI